MSAELVVLPTREAYNEHRKIFEAVPANGLPLMILTQFLVTMATEGEEEPLGSCELTVAWIDFLKMQKLYTNRMRLLSTTSEFRVAIYALYQVIQQTQELLLSNANGIPVSLLAQGWNGADLVVYRELVRQTTDHSFNRR